MTHVVEVEVKRFYKVYVEDEENVLTDAQVEAAARKMIAEDGINAMDEDEEMEFEVEDVECVRYSYSF